MLRSRDEITLLRRRRARLPPRTRSVRRRVASGPEIFRLPTPRRVAAAVLFRRNETTLPAEPHANYYYHIISTSLGARRRAAVVCCKF